MNFETFFLINTESLTLQSLQKQHNLDPVIKQLKSLHKYKTKPIKADITTLGNKTLLRHFLKFNRTAINKNNVLEEYHTSETKLPCLPSSMGLPNYPASQQAWIAKFGLSEIFVTDNGTEIMVNEITTLCHLSNININLEHPMTHRQIKWIS